MAYVYQHIRLDTGNPFYIGIANSDTSNFKRAYRKDGRNPIWLKIVSKTKYIVEILHKNVTWEDAKRIEIELISKYKRIKDGGILSNLTLGGDGILGLRNTAWNKGKKLHYDVWSKGKKMSDKFRLACSENVKRKIELYGHHMKGRKHSVESRNKMSLSKIGVKQSEKQKKAIKDSRIRKRIGLFKNGILVNQFDSIELASKYTGINKGIVSSIINKKRQTPKKFNYELKEI